MTFREILQKIRDNQAVKKARLREAEEQLKIQKILENREKSSNERELERYYKEDREQMIKNRLEVARKIRERDIAFNHNPINIKNITNHTEWEVLKEKNQFANTKNIFSNQPMIHKSNHKLLMNNKSLYGI